MAEQSHREEMNAAIRAQRDRQAAGRQEALAPPPAAAKSLRARMVARLRGK